jgi:hypothetical protein
MLQQPMLLNAFYDAGNKIGPVLTWFFIIMMTIGVVYTMAKYLGGSEKK